MLKREKLLIQEIADAALDEKGKFRLDEFIDNHNINAPREKVLEILFGYGLVFAEKTPELTPTAWFFRKGKLLIHPLQEEIDEGILIPGHRFVPFYLPDRLPNEIQLDNGKTGYCSRKMVVKTLKQLSKYYILFGLHYLPELLAAESEANLDAIGTGTGGTDTLVRISVFDMADFYKSSNFRPGDFILCEMEDFREGIFSYSYVPAENIEKSRSEEWRQRISSGFTKIFRQFDAPTDNFRMLAHAYFFAGRKAVTTPGLHLAAFINDNDVVDITRLGERYVLWKKDENLDIFETSQKPYSRLKEFEDADGTIETILADIGLSLDTEEIEAYMRNALYHKDDFYFTIGRILYKSNCMFASREQEESFYALLLEYWDDLEDEYSGSEDRYDELLRETLLSIHHAHLLFLRELDEKRVMPEEIPEKEFWELRDLMGQVENLLAALNNESDLTESAFKEMNNMLEPLETIFAEISGTIRNRIGIDSSPVDSRFYYIIHISLEGTSPPVWRRIRVPGNCSLRELHDIIQLSFGWQNYHLHSFFVGDSEYSDTEFFEDGDGEEIEDEREFLIEDLGLSEEDTLTYVYDYGDNWSHRLIIEELLPAEKVERKERAFGKCIGGERAAPPEDCGGIGGYAELIEILNEPIKTLDDEARHFREWAGGYDPDFFSIDRTNGRIRRYMY